jgi:hypothetical protein
MKHILARAVLAAGLLATLTVGAGSQPAKAQEFPAYTSGVQVANLEAAEASVTLNAYNSDGTANGDPLTDTIPANGSKTYFPITNVTSGFQGAIVISSSRRVAAISNILSSTFSAGGSYVGSSQGATTVLLPLLNFNNAGFYTWFSLQNAGTAPANVSINYSDGTSDTASIPVGAAEVFYQKQENHTQAIFAGTVTSDQPLVAAVLQENPSLIFAYTGFTGGSTNPVFPIINANNPTPQGYVTGLQIQNAGDTASDITVTYTPTGDANTGTACTETQTIPPGDSRTYALQAFTLNATNPGTSDCVKGARFVGSARVTVNSASQPLVGIGNQLLFSGANGGAYSAFDASNATAKVVMPLIMDRNNGFFTGFNVQNVGSEAADVQCVFSLPDDPNLPDQSAYTVSANLAPGAALNDIQLNKIPEIAQLPNQRYVGGATCTATPSTAKLVAVVNELGPDLTLDQLLVYEGAASQ